MTGVQVGVGHGADAQEKITVSVSYNGLTKEFESRTTETVQSLLSHAIKAFGIQNQPHLLSLFTEANVELSDNQSLAEAGVHSGESLLLRPGAVKGGR
jgi:pore localization protein NPL4